MQSATPGKSRESFLEAFAQHDAEAETLSCGLVQSLTHSEMQFIDEYADKLTRAGVSEEEAVNLSVQSFAKGIDSAHKRLSLGPLAQEANNAEMDTMDVEVAIHQATQSAAKLRPTHLRWDEAGNEVVMQEVLASQTNDLGFFGASLRKLFHTDDEETETDAGEDAKLVMLYAAEVCLSGGIDPEVAHGVALDTFLESPEEFRARVHSISPDDAIIADQSDAACDEAPVESIDAAQEMQVDDDDDMVEVEDESPAEVAAEVDEAVADEADLETLRSLLHDKVSKPRHTAATPRRAGRLLNTPATRVATTAKPSASARRAQQGAHDDDASDFASHFLGQQSELPTAIEGPTVESKAAVTFAEEPVVLTVDTSAPVSAIIESNSSVSEPVSEETAVAGESVPEQSVTVVEEVSPTEEVSKPAAKGKGKKEAPSKAKGKAAPKPVEVVEEDEELIEIIVLFCDGCDKEVPLDETGLDAVPEGDWFCTKCVSKTTAKKGSKALSSKAKKSAAVAVEEEEEDLVLLCDGYEECLVINYSFRSAYFNAVV